MRGGGVQGGKVMGHFVSVIAGLDPAICCRRDAYFSAWQARMMRVQASFSASVEVA
jgi:hypothetical protein